MFHGSERSHLPAYLRRALELEELGRTLAYASTRCWGWRDLQSRIGTIWRGEDSEVVISRLAEMALTEEEAEAFAAELRQLAIACEALRAADRQRADRRLIRLRGFLPDTERTREALADLKHTRKIRREAAYKLLRDLGVASEYVPALLAAYEHTGEQRWLELIARSERTLACVDPIWLIEQLEKPYWQMRIVAELIRQHDARVLEIRSRFPRAFIHAVGRVGASEYAPCVDETVRAHLNDFSLLDLAAWTYGKLRHEEGLALIQRTLDQELEREPIAQYFRAATREPTEAP